MPEGKETRIYTDDLEKQHTKLVNPMKVITTGKNYNVNPNQDPDKLSEAISDDFQAFNPKKMVESDAKTNHEEYKDLPHKPEVNLKQTIITFGMPANATTINPEVNMTNLPSGVMINAASSLENAPAGLWNYTNNNAINLSEEDMNETIKSPQPNFQPLT
ncbi:hypothetical protein DSO57_1027597 [Entomophthora muscae]|uniref:Uncharacterized protein n=1 Tax=Entomophthora muscae TaxID=34485 RepID=A0ACC2UBC2_9FUNG|nr:hypothetical protein DSO57_1027597 [Entomophthora muscae]